MSYNTASFAIPPNSRYHIDVGIMGADCHLRKVNMSFYSRREEGNCLIPTSILADTGNDVTILRTSTARKLGYDPVNMPGEWMPVAGISNIPANFKKFNNMIKIQNLRPIWIPMGLATKEEDLAEDLLGRAGILDGGRYEILYAKDSVKFIEKHFTPHTSDDESNELPSYIRESNKPVRNQPWETTGGGSEGTYDFIHVV